MGTSDRIVDAAMAAFGGSGYDATSLDDLASELGIRKQSILYHFPSKEILLDAVVDQAVAELTAVMWAVIETSDEGFARVEAMVRGVFRMAIRRPELLGLIREVTRLGPPVLNRATDALEPLIKGATEWLREEMRQGRVRESDPRLLAFSVYSTVMGVATEVEVLRAVGIEPTLRDTALRRRELLRFLRSALEPS
ncbi:MAG: TetR/AcrR family transcriptional regulator [Acidimicrobiales bacterium]